MSNHTVKKIPDNKRRTNVLLAVADQDFAQAIAGFVKDHNWPQNTCFHIFYVVEEPPIRRVLRFSPDIAKQIIKEDEQFGEGLVEKIERKLHESIKDAQIETSLGCGFAKNEILEKAAAIKADFIVLGAHGRLGISSIFAGSVSAAVMMEAGCSVLIVRLGDNQEAIEVSEPETAGSYLS